MDGRKLRTFRVEFEIGVECDSWSEGQEIVKNSLLSKDIRDSKIVRRYNIRSEAQNNALHLWFELVAQACFDAGIDLHTFLSQSVGYTVTKDDVKRIWKQVQETMFEEKSTSKLTTKQLNDVHEVINRFMGEKHGIHVPFPSIEGLTLTMENPPNRAY